MAILSEITEESSMNMRTNRVKIQVRQGKVRQVRIAALFFTLLYALIIFPEQSAAYFSTMDTGDIIAAGRYRITAEPQIILNKYDGFNLTGRFSTGLTPDAAVEALVGGGEIDFQLGGFYKWVPFPD